MDISCNSVSLQPLPKLLSRPEQLGHHGTLADPQLARDFLAAVTHHHLQQQRLAILWRQLPDIAPHQLYFYLVVRLQLRICGNFDRVHIGERGEVGAVTGEGDARLAVT